MPKKRLQIMLPEEVLTNFEKVADSAHMDATTYAALWISRVSDLKLDNGLNALTSIPKDYFRQRGGRPQSVGDVAAPVAS